MENPFEIIIEKLMAIDTRIESVELSLNFKHIKQAYSEVKSKLWVIYKEKQQMIR